MNRAMKQENVFGDLVWFVSPENAYVIQDTTTEILIVTIVSTPNG